MKNYTKALCIIWGLVAANFVANLNASSNIWPQDVAAIELGLCRMHERNVATCMTHYVGTGVKKHVDFPHYRM